MLEFFKKLFGSSVKVPATKPAPYKVEAPAAEPSFPVKKAAKKPTVKKATTRKPKAPKA